MDCVFDLTRTRSSGDRSASGWKQLVHILHSGRIMIMVAASRRVGRSTPAMGCKLVAIAGCPPPPAPNEVMPDLDWPASSISRSTFHHLFNIFARRSTSSGVRIRRLVFEGWCNVLRRNGTRVDRTTTIRAEVMFLAVSFENSASRVRNVDQSGSRDVGCGIVMVVSSVDSDAFSEAEAVVLASSDEEPVWDELRGVEDGVMLRLKTSFLLVGMASLGTVADVLLLGGSLTAVEATEEVEEAEEAEEVVVVVVVAALVGADGAVLSTPAGLELRFDEADKESEEALLTNTLCGFCLMRVR